MSAKYNVVSIGLSAAIVAVESEQPVVLVVAHDGSDDALPFGPFDPAHHRTLESGLRKWVGEQTRFDLGYTEQLYTFGDKGRHTPTGGDKGRQSGGARVVSVGYLALTRRVKEAPETQWRGWYHYFPWEDWRDTRPAMIDSVILPALKKFVKDALNAEAAELRRERVNVCFGEGWDEERVLERYELLYEAGLVEEFYRDGGKSGAGLGTAMLFDHRRILATAIARLRDSGLASDEELDASQPAFCPLAAGTGGGGTPLAAGVKKRGWAPGFRALGREGMLLRQPGCSATDWRRARTCIPEAGAGCQLAHL